LQSATDKKDPEENVKRCYQKCWGTFRRAGFVRIKS
jgi:hypothetical protein